jgi:hypothetical protein
MLKPVENTIRRGLSSKEKTREDEPISITLHTYVETHNETPCRAIFNK